MRKRIYEIIEKSNGEDRLSSVYDIFMIIVIIASLIPLAFKEDTTILSVIDKVTVAIFIVDYLLRLATADFKYENKSVMSFLRYPLSPMAIIDLLSILPSFIPINSGFKAFRVLRMIRAFRVIRVFKAMRYSKSLIIISDVLRNSKDSLLACCFLAIGYVIVSALIVFNVEPETFDNFFTAIYWATVSLTTVGYGDIYPVTTIGQIVTMFSSVFGIAIVALPAGIITAGYMSALDRSHDPDSAADKENQ